MKSNLTYFFPILLLIINCTPKVHHLAKIDNRSYRIEQASYPINVKVASQIEPYKRKLDATMNEVLATSNEELIKGKPSSTLTNWFCDAIKEGAELKKLPKMDFFINNYGGIRLASLPKGDVTLSKIYEIMPFDNTVTIVEIDGKTLEIMLDQIAQDDGWPVSEGLSFHIEFGKAKNILIQNEPIDYTKTYQAGLPDFVVNGGDRMNMLANLNKTNTEVLMRDILVEYAKNLTKNGKTIIPNPANRITH